MEAIIKNKHKNNVRKYCSNIQCFKEKNYKAKFLTISILKRKFDKDNFREKHCGKKKNMRGNIVAIDNVLKKKNYKVKFSTSSMVKKKST